MDTKQDVDFRSLEEHLNIIDRNTAIQEWSTMELAFLIINKLSIIEKFSPWQWVSHYFHRQYFYIEHGIVTEHQKYDFFYCINMFYKTYKTFWNKMNVLWDKIKIYLAKQEEWMTVKLTCHLKN